MTGMVLSTVQQNLTNNRQPAGGESITPLVLLHGLFGSADNWASRTRIYARHTPTIAMDLRNHGENQHVGSMDYPSMTDDVLTTLDSLNIDQCHLLGHSMGGKVAMQLATREPARVKNLIVVDISPRAYPPHHRQLIDAMQTVPLENLAKRSDADAILATVEAQTAVRWFLLKSLMRIESAGATSTKTPAASAETNNRYRWQFNLETIAENYTALADAVVLPESFAGPTLFIKGANSDYLGINDRELIYSHFPAARLKVIDSAGHWPHAEKPSVFDHIVSGFLNFDQAIHEIDNDV